MPLKPIYEKSPLVALTELPLRSGQVRLTNDTLNKLYALTDAAKDQPRVWEGAFRLACLLTVKPMEEKCAKWIAAALAQQSEDGSFAMPVEQAVALMRAALAMYELDARRPLLEQMVKWCAWVAKNWEKVLACDAVRIHSADLMELLLALYRVTGKKAVLALCVKLRQQAMDWSGILHTFAVQRSMSRITSWKDMEAGMEAEDGSEAGFYTRQYLTCHAESLADGMRASALNGQYSGNGQEISAGKIGWEKISRFHGAVCGGVTADETIGGTSPSCAVDAASLGAWAEAFCYAPAGEAWAYEALEILIENGLSAALVDDKLVPFQRVNSLSINSGTKDCYHVHESNEQVWRAMSRLCRGWASAASHAVTVSQKGAAINLYMPGKYAVPMADNACVLTMAGENGRHTVTIHTKTTFKAALNLRIPAWTDSACITVNAEGGKEGKPGTWLTVERAWNDGDTITIEFTRKLTITEGHHQSACVSYGAKVMAYPVTEDNWAVALCGEPEVKDGIVIAPLKRVPSWRKRGSIPADLPVLPETEGEIMMAELSPYAETPCRIALFPRGGKA